MRRLAVFGKALLAPPAILAVAVLARGADAPIKTPQYSVEVRVSPVGDAAARQYVGEATIKDLATGKTVFAPRVELIAGSAGVASGTDEKGRDFSVSFSVEGEGKEGRFSLQVRDGETLIASEKVAIKLR
jgi:hypothetical protein